MGTALIIYNTIQLYIHNIMAFQRTILAIDFYFPNNKTHIISVYLPTNNPDLLARTQNQITLWSTESKIRN